MGETLRTKAKGHEMTPAGQRWTRDVKEPGWYWWRWKAIKGGAWNVSIINVISHPNGGLYSSQIGDMCKPFGEFQGPLTPNEATE